MSDRFRPLLDKLDERPVGDVIESDVFGRVRSHGARSAESLVVLGELLALPAAREFEQSAAPDQPDAA